MYSQYQYYQQSNQPVTAQQGATSWNGSAWVANSSPSMTSSTYSTYEQPVKPVTIPPNPVETFTEYYHAWTAHGKECEEYLRHLPGNNGQRPNMQRQVEWAKYYADESSRAAHHFYSNPNATSAPFDLPPAPPKSSQNKQQQTPQQQQQQQQQPRHVQQQQQQQQQAPKQSSSDENTPGSLTRYVKRCIDQCSTDEQRKAVQAEVEKAIAKAIQTGELHTKNWALVPLIPVAGNNKLSFSIAPQPNNKHHIRQQQQQYGTSKHSPLDNVFNNNSRVVGKNNTTTKYSKRYDDKLPANDSYYGHGGGGGGGNTSPPSSNTSHHRRGSNFSDSSFGRRTSNQSSGGYYGPASESQQQSYGPSSRYIDNSNTASYYGAADSSSPLSSSQKRVISPDEDFIAFQQKRKQKKQKKNGFEKSDKALAKRANRFSGPGGISDASKSASTVDGHDQYMGKKLIGGSKATLDEEDFQKMTVKGTCNTLEKEYLRLTAPPRAELVRPKPILERHLENLKQAYAKKKRDYLWFCSQLKAIRQDCTVQRIQEAFTVDVYETHARIALQEGDLNEYNQCQTQLKELYELGHSMGNEDEFIAYRLLYYVFLTTNEKYDGGSSDMFKILLSLTAVQRKHTAIAHALNTREALASGDYLQFFRLHQNSPGLSGYLSDLIVPTMRMRGLRRMVKAYRPSLQVEVFQNQLGFDSMKDCTDFLTSCGCAVEGTTCVTKDSTVHEPVEEKKNSLI